MEQKCISTVTIPLSRHDELVQTEVAFKAKSVLCYYYEHSGYLVSARVHEENSVMAQLAKEIQRLRNENREKNCKIIDQQKIIDQEKIISKKRRFWFF